MPSRFSNHIDPAAPCVLKACSAWRAAAQGCRDSVLFFYLDPVQSISYACGVWRRRHGGRLLRDQSRRHERGGH